MEGLPVFHPLQSLKTNTVLLEQREVFGRKVAPDDTQQASRCEEARSHGRMAGGAAQQARVF